MSKQEFKTESKKLLDLMIHSIYTHKEIFLRELISNASDSIDKLYYKVLSEKKTGIKREDFFIRIELDKKTRTIAIIDNGIGMNKEELANNLGTIAKSGSLDFKKLDEVKDEKDIDIIGQFGVGFYSAFMVAKKIQVISKAYGSDETYEWVSEGVDGFTISKSKDDTVEAGTKIILTLKDDEKDEKFSMYLEEYEIKSLIKKYSDYVRFPIKMLVEKEIPDEEKNKDKKDDAPIEYKKIQEDETLNSMVPLWKRPKKDVKDEDYNNFYKETFNDYTDPFKVIRANVEGQVNYNALLFIPAKAPFNYYSKDYEKGLALYSSGVMIMEKCKELIPDYFNFIRGVVDTDDLSLNISREILQNDRQLLAIAMRIEKKIEQELKNLLEKKPDEYAEFFKQFGVQIKYGIYDGFGANKDKLQDYLIYYSSTQKKYVTLKDYISRMKKDQKYIYYQIADTIEMADKMPATESIKEKGYEILYMTESIDDFVIKMIKEYDKKELKSVTDSNLDEDIDTKAKEKIEKAEKANKDLLQKIKESLGDKVKEVKFSARLKQTPVILVAAKDSAMSLEMEKILKSQPGLDMMGMNVERVLELNPDHKITKKLKTISDDDKLIKKYANVLYNQALLIAGDNIEDPTTFVNDMAELIS